ncbi:MAG: hypothetical protein ACHQQQ_03305 [Bacteroidota bacterium]
MLTLIDVVAAAGLPTHVLFKNLELNYVQGEGKILSFDWAKPGDSIVELKNLIPKPTILPSDPKQLNYFLNCYSWSKVKEFEAHYDEQTYEFDDSLNSFDNDPMETRSKDFLMYGESYTILWLCLPQRQIVIDYLMDYIKKLTNNYTTMHWHHLGTFFRDYIYRMYCFPDDFISPLMLRRNIQDSIELMLEEHVLKLPKIIDPKIS